MKRFKDPNSLLKNLKLRLINESKDVKEGLEELLKLHLCPLFKFPLDQNRKRSHG